MKRLRLAITYLLIVAFAVGVVWAVVTGINEERQEAEDRKSMHPRK
ncbi:MAG TPA: hypothetical protein VFG04_30915 [Planctomycetaceae bacterium]|jgi:hypothetical protein|nr:hypothetical protein [Planctomycetaceae bacterium]